jgi:oligopeptide transport system substrate-binding protein
MTKTKWSLLLVLGLVLSLFLVACSGDKKDDAGKETDDQDTETPAEDPAEEPAEVEQVFNLANGDRIPTMDSSMATDTYAFEFLNATMEGLYRLGPEGKPVEGIATKHEISEDGLTWTFTLREDAKWSNGDPVTAHDFVYAWRRAVDPATGSEYGPYMMGGVIKNATAVNNGEVPVEELGVKADGDFTLVVELENPTPYFDSLTTFGTFLPLNQKFVEEQGDKYATSTDTLVFNGPFTLEDWESTSDSWKLVKNPNYWDAATVKLEEINYTVVKETQVALDLYLKGEIDRTGLSSDLVDQYRTHEDFRQVPESAVFYLKMNQERNGKETPLANKNIRHAISRAIDKQAFVDTILNNGSVVANYLVPTDFTTHPETGETFREINGNFNEYNPEEALTYWEKGLEELGVDSIELEYLGDDGDSAIRTAEFFKHQLETNLPGLTVKIRSVPFEQRLEADTNQDYDLQHAGWGPDYLDPMTWLSLWVTDGGNNKMGYSNPKYDELIEAAATTLATDPVKRYEAFLEAEKILFEDAAIAPTFQRNLAQLWSPKLQGVQINLFGATYEYKWAYAAPVEE